MPKTGKLEELVRYVLPKEIVDYFELESINEENETLHLYLDGLNAIPPEYSNLSLLPNGFYAESTIKDFPLRDKKVILHVRRRRWIDALGKSYSRDWELTAAGTRYSREFASFLRERLDTCPVTARSLENYCHIDGIQPERHYKEHPSDYSTWKQKEHAEEWLLFPENTGTHLSMETSLSNGELYTIVTGKAAKGKKGAPVAIVAGIKPEDVNAVLDKAPEEELNRVEEITLDMSESMRKTVRHGFPKAQRVIDRFHVQKLAFDAIREMRIATVGMP
jgi:transposase